MSDSEWIRLSREEANKVLNRLSTYKDAIVFSKDVTEVSYQRLTFYSNYKLYRLVNYATMPTFTMMYLCDSDRFLTIDGLANPIYTANEKDHVKINPVTIIPYLDFFFNNVKGSEGDVFLIKEPNNLPFIDQLDSEQKAGVQKCFREIKVKKSDSEDGAYDVEGNLYYGGSIIHAKIHVASDGKIQFHDQKMLMSGIFIPENPYKSVGMI